MCQRNFYDDRTQNPNSAYMQFGAGRTYTKELDELNVEIDEVQRIVHFFLLFKQPVPPEYQRALDLYEQRNYVYDHMGDKLPYHSFVPNYNPKFGRQFNYPQ